MEEDFIYIDVNGDSTLQNLNTVFENEKINEVEKINKNENEQDFIVIDEPNNKKKNKKKKKNAKKNKTYINPTYDRPIIIDDDVYIDFDNEKSDSSDENIISSNAFDILNKTTFNDYMDDEVIKDYIENCRDDDSENTNKENEFFNSTFAKNILKSDVGVETEPIEMEMDLIKLLENKLSSDSSDSSSEELSEIESKVPNNNNNNSNNNNNNISKTDNSLTMSSISKNKNKNKKKKKGKKNNKKKINSNSKTNNMPLNVENDNTPIIEIEKVISELDKEKKLENKDKTINKNNENEITGIIEIEDDDDDTNNEVDIITLLENGEDKSSNEASIISFDEKRNNDKSDVIIISDNDKDTSSDDQEVILIDNIDDSDDSNDSDDSDESDESDDDNSEDDFDNINMDDEDDDDDEDEDEDEDENIFKRKLGQRKILMNDDDNDYLYDGGFEGGESTWDLNDKELEEKLKNSKFKAIVNSDKDQLLRLQKKKLQKKELSQKKEYLLKKKENLKKENKRIQKVLKSKKGNRLQTSPEVFKYLKHVNTTIKEFVINGFESIPLGNLPSELRKSVGMIAIEYGVKIKTRGSGKRKVTNLIRTSRSKIPDNWNTIVETVFSKTEAQRHSNMDVRKRNLDMAKRRGKYHNNNNNKGKSSVNKPQLGSKVGENANPISDTNKGFKLLQSMGWTPGESLGNDNSNGLINPIEVVVRDQSGLGASYFDQGYSHSSSSTSQGLGLGLGLSTIKDDDMDEYERDILYNSNSAMFSSKKNKKGKRNKRFSNDNFGLGRKSRNSVISKRSSRFGETGGLENSPYNFVNFQKSSSLFTQE